MITKQRTLFYFVGDQAFKSLEEAQKVDLMTLMPVFAEEPQGMTHEGIADWMLKNSKAIVDILTTTPTSRLKARKSHGATRKPRKQKTPCGPEPTAA